MIGQAGEDAVRWMPGDEPVEYAPPVDADGQGDCNGANWRRTQKTAGELMKVSRCSTQRAAAVKNGPDLTPAVEHVTVADAYRIREEAANSRAGVGPGRRRHHRYDAADGAGPSLGHWPHFPTYFCGADKSSLSDPAVLTQE